MLALTLNDPYAMLMALGLKTIETRSWRAPQSAAGRIAIHASKGFDRDAADTCVHPDFYPHLLNAGFDHCGALPRGAILCTVELYDCIGVERVDWSRYPPHERIFGDYGEKRWAWLTRDLRRLPNPVQARGLQKLWPVPRDVLEKIPGRYR